MIRMQSRGLWSTHCPFCGGYQSVELDGLRLTERCYGAGARMEEQQEVGSGGEDGERAGKGMKVKPRRGSPGRERMGSRLGWTELHRRTEME